MSVRYRLPWLLSGRGVYRLLAQSSTAPATPGGSGVGFDNNGGVLILSDPTGWPLSDAGLPAGGLYYNGGPLGIKPGHTPDPLAPPIYFGTITALQFLALGGGDLPLTDPLNPGQIWNNGNEPAVS